MARSTKSLAGSAVSAARKAIRRKPAVTAEKPADRTTARKTAKKTAKKAPATSATKAPAKNAAQKTAKAGATKDTTKKATAKAPAKKAPAKKVPAKKATTKAPAKKTATKAAKKTATKKSVAQPAKKSPAKKVAPKKATTPGKVSALVVKEGESAWTKAEIKEVRAELTEHREKVAATLAAQEEELALLMRDAGDGAGQDQADMGATSFERDHELTVVNNEREKLAQIDRALARLDDGSYGNCESCGEPIGKMRLLAFPRATLCLTCKQREERR